MKTPTGSDPFPKLACAPGAGSLRFSDIRMARENLRSAIRPTPCMPSPELGREAGVTLVLKRDDLLPTGSFKERGAANALAGLSQEQRRRGVVAASAGNHALGLARHGRRLEIPVTLVMPENAARAKIERCRALGAEVVLVGSSFAEAERHARALVMADGRTWVHPFDDPAVMAGQGTMALEVLEQAPEVDALVVPVGGGGLLAGVVTAVKASRPEVMVVAVEPKAAPSFSAASAKGGPVEVAVGPTVADGLAVARVGERAFRAAFDRVDAVVTVSEDEIATAMLRIFEAERITVEGAGAVALSAVLASRLPASLIGRTVAVPLTGANTDARTFAAALQRGLEVRYRSEAAAVADGRAAYGEARAANSRDHVFSVRT